MKNPPSAGTNNETLQQRNMAKEAELVADNAKKARQFAGQEYPGEKWKREGERIFVSPRRKRGNFEEEFRDAQILRDLGSTVYLVPENNRQPGTKYDAIVFINLETSDLSRHEVMGALYRAMNSVTHTDMYGNIIKGYAERNKFDGGRIILKLKGHKNLVYLNVDDLKPP